MSLFATATELEDELLPTLRSFLASPEGQRIADAVRERQVGSVVALHISDPDTRVWVDFEALEVGCGNSREGVAEVTIDADAVHHMGMNQLPPVQVSRAIEERRLDANGSFELLLLLMSSLDALGEQWRETLHSHQRYDLLEAPAASEVLTYSVETALVRQGHMPPWADKAKRAVSKSTRRTN